MAITKAALRNVGGFDPMFTAAGDDVVAEYEAFPGNDQPDAGGPRIDPNDPTSNALVPGEIDGQPVTVEYAPRAVIGVCSARPVWSSTKTGPSAFNSSGSRRLKSSMSWMAHAIR